MRGSSLAGDFCRPWVLALSGRLKFASLTFTPPKYGSALVINTSFSSEREEQDASHRRVWRGAVHPSFQASHRE